MLNVSKCGMTDTGVASLADALHTNNTLDTLFIRDNAAITENGLTCLVEAVSKHSGLKRLYIPFCIITSTSLFGVDIYKVKKTINEARMRNGLPDIDMD